MTDEELRSENLERGLTWRRNMSTLEEGLKDVVDKFARVGGGNASYADRYSSNGNTRKAAMTGPEVIQAIENLEKRADEIQAMACDLADILTGPEATNATPFHETTPPTSIFDRMGVELMRLTRTLTNIEADVRRALGAVKP